MKNFKINALILLGLMVSMTAKAEIVYNVPITQETFNGDPYTCQVDLTIKSPLPNASYIRYYEYSDYGDGSGYGYEIEEFQNKKEMPISIQGYREILVIAGNQLLPINAPALQAPQNTNASVNVNTSNLYPRPSFYVTKATLYKYSVTHPIIEHRVVLNADLVTNLASFQLYSTSGGEDENGRKYCGYEHSIYLVYKKMGSNMNRISVNSQSNPIEPLSLTPGTYEYFVYASEKQINAPARDESYIPDPGMSDYWIGWGDRFLITVNRAECQSNLVYTKWDDVLFVDNGEDGGNGEFVEYQWFNEGEKLEGETKQWMRVDGTPSGRYYVSIKDVAGNEIITCPTYFNALPKSQPNNPYQGSSSQVAPKRLENGRLVIEHNGFLYNAQGKRMK